MNHISSVKVHLKTHIGNVNITLYILLHVVTTLPTANDLYKQFRHKIGLGKLDPNYDIIIIFLNYY